MSGIKGSLNNPTGDGGKSGIQDVPHQVTTGNNTQSFIQQPVHAVFNPSLQFVGQQVPAGGMPRNPAQPQPTFIQYVLVPSQTAHGFHQPMGYPDAQYGQMPQHFPVNPHSQYAGPQIPYAMPQMQQMQMFSHYPMMSAQPQLAPSPIVMYPGADSVPTATLKEKALESVSKTPTEEEDDVTLPLIAPKVGSLPPKWPNVDIIKSFSIDHEQTQGTKKICYNTDIIDKGHLFHFLKRSIYTHITPKAYRSLLRKLVSSNGPVYNKKNRDLFPAELLELLEKRINEIGRGHWGFKQSVEKGLSTPSARKEQARVEKHVSEYSEAVREVLQLTSKPGPKEGLNKSQDTSATVHIEGTAKPTIDEVTEPSEQKDPAKGQEQYSTAKLDEDKRQTTTSEKQKDTLKRKLSNSKSDDSDEIKKRK
mmetsp:Transcript_34595/g.55283  ORF Transcript_34595/g.55283 Transcript_34595/m.55283 type:complete len:420 (-) Transcript_34595:1500-2759(-)